MKPPSVTLRMKTVTIRFEEGVLASSCFCNLKVKVKVKVKVKLKVVKVQPTSTLPQSTSTGSPAPLLADACWRERFGEDKDDGIGKLLEEYWKYNGYILDKSKEYWNIT